MKEYVFLFHQIADSRDDLACPESKFATYCYTAAKAFNIYNAITQRDAEQVADYIQAITDSLSQQSSGIFSYPETTDTVTNEAAKCYRGITEVHAHIIIERINGRALHKSTMFSTELIDSITDYLDEYDINYDETFIDVNDLYLAIGQHDYPELSQYYMITVDENVFLKKINVSTEPRAVRERLQRFKSRNGIVTDRTLEVATAAAISTTLTLALVIVSSIEIQVFKDNGIDITSLWSLWIIVLALGLNLFIASVTTDWNWYYFVRLKSVEKSIGQRHLEMINCCKHDLLHALSGGYLEDIFKVVNEDTSFISDSFRGGDILLNLTYNVEDMELSCPNIWKHYDGGYRMKEGPSFKILVPTGRQGNTAYFNAEDLEETQYRFSSRDKATVTRVK